MSRAMSLLLSWLAVAALLVSAACSPTVFGDRTVSGERPKAMMGGDARYDFQRTLKVQAESKGEMMKVTITTEGGQACEIDFKLVEMISSYPGLPFMSQTKELRYEGQWPDNLSTDCLKVAEAPGGTKAVLRVYEPEGGERNAVICTDDTSGLCTKNLNIAFKL